MLKHVALYISNKENKNKLIKRIVSGELGVKISHLKYVVFSQIALNKFIDEEMRHGHFNVKTKTTNSLKNSSQGERRKALLKHIISQKPECIIIDNVFDSLDVQAQIDIEETLTELSTHILIIQLSNRTRDILSFIDILYKFENDKFVLQSGFDTSSSKKTVNFTNTFPDTYLAENNTFSSLIKLNKVAVSYHERCIVKNISWEIKPKEFWQLIGPNGSGKSTILKLITGDNPKGFLQDMTLFGMKKGSGESVWDIKKHIGFFSSDMLIGFKRKDSIENMIISGFLDSIGLYKCPNERQVNIAHQWLRLLNMFEIKDESFKYLSDGHKRLVLIARAMVKQPPLLILDEPTNGLDDVDAEIFSELINKIAAESNTAILYVSHRAEKTIKPEFIYELVTDESPGYSGVVKKV